MNWCLTLSCIPLQRRLIFGVHDLTVNSFIELQGYSCVTLKKCREIGLNLAEFSGLIEVTALTIY
jgi:hypothetical protein